MTTLQITLPDELAKRAATIGLLSDAAIAQMLEAAIRRDAADRLGLTLAHVDALNLPPMSEADVEAEIQAARAARRAS